MRSARANEVEFEPGVSTEKKCSPNCRGVGTDIEFAERETTIEIAVLVSPFVVMSGVGVMSVEAIGVPVATAPCAVVANAALPKFRT